jgi:hypothetical protein
MDPSTLAMIYALETAFAIGGTVYSAYKVSDYLDQFDEDRSVIKTSPAPRLVNVELNPGPTPLKGKHPHPHPRKKNSKMTPSLLKTSGHLTNPASMEPIRNTKSAPVAVGTRYSPFAKFSTATNGELQGLRISGFQRISTIYQVGSSGAGVPSLLVGSVDNTLGLNPTTLNGPLGTIGPGFLRFQFKHIRPFYKAGCASSVNGEVTLAYDTDGYTASVSTITAGNAGSLTVSDETSAWLPTSVHAPVPQYDKLYYVFVAGSAPADYRDLYQGAVIVTGVGISAGATGTIFGDLWIEYICDLYELGNSASLSFYTNILRNRVKTPYTTESSSRWCDFARLHEESEKRSQGQSSLVIDASTPPLTRFFR